MGLFPWDDDTHMSALARRLYIQAYRKQNLPEGQADLLTRYSSAWPTVDPRILVPLAQAGYEPNSPVVQKIMALEQKQPKHKDFFGKVGERLGGVKRAAGNAVGAVAHAADTALGPVDEFAGDVALKVGNPAMSAAKPVVRTAFVVMETGQQTVNNFIRTQLYTYSHLGEDLRKGGPGAVLDRFSGGLAKQQTSGGLALGRALAGDEVDLGSGILPGGDIEEAVRNSAGQLEGDMFGVHFGGEGGIAFTPGRVVAATMFEPGTANFNAMSGITDAGVAWNTDPFNAAGHFAKTAEALPRLGRAATRVRSGDSLLTAARELKVKPTLATITDDTLQGRYMESVMGAIPGHRPTFIPDVSDSWIDKGGNGIISKFTEATDPVLTHEASGRKFTLDMSNRLAAARTDDEVKAVFRETLGRDVRETPEFNGVKVRAMNRQGVRMWGMMPSPGFLANDLEDGYVQLRRTLVNMGASPEVRDAGLARWMQHAAEGGDPALATTVVRDILDSAAGEMAAKVRVKVRLTRNMGEADDAFAARKAAAEAAARKERVSGTEGLLRMFYKNIDESRFYAGDEIIANDMAKGIINDGEAIPAQTPLLTAEFTTRVVPLPEPRAVRKAVSRLNRLVDNPFFKSTEGMLDDLTQGWKVSKVLKPNTGLRVVGEQQARAAAAGMPSLFDGHPLTFIASLMANPKAAAKYLKGRYNQRDVLGPGFFTKESESGLIEMADGLSDKTQQLAGNVTASRHHVPLRQNERGFNKAWHSAIVNLGGDPIARKVAEQRGNLDMVERWLTTTPEGQALHRAVATKMPQFAGNAGGRDYLEMVARIVKYRTGGDAAVMDAVATGMFKGKALGALDSKGVWVISDDFAEHLKHVSPPSVVPGMRVFNGAKEVGRVNRATNMFFDAILTKPDNFFSRSPMLRGLYWQRIEEQLPYMDDLTRARAMKMAAIEGGADPRRLARMRRVNAHMDTLTPTLPDETIVHFATEPFAADVPPQFHYSPHAREEGRLADDAPLGDGEFGPGFYTTDSLHEATRKRPGDPDAQVYQAHWGRSGSARAADDAPRILDLNDTIPANVASQFRREVEGLERTPEVQRFLDSLDDLTGVEAYRRFRRLMKEEGADVEAALGKVNDAIRIGYDGMRHTVGDSSSFTWLSRDVSAHTLTTSTKVPEQARRGIITSLDDADHIAKRYAVNTMRRTLYHHAERSQFFDAMRLIFPFGEPWKEVVTGWTKAAWQNPRVVRRGQQIITAARGNPNAGPVYKTDEDGTEHHTGNGFFHKDQYGNEVFNMPFGGHLTKMAVGVPIPLTGSASGLSVMADALPGTGFVLQVPAAMLLPNDPSWDFARKTIFPFAPEDYSAGILEATAPTWVKRAKGYFDKGDPRGYSSLVSDASSYLASTGKFDLNDPDDMTEMLDRANAMAKRLQVIRTFAAAGAPTALSPEFVVQVAGEDGDKQQSLIAMWELKNTWQKLLKDNQFDFDAATDEFLARFGEDALLATESDTIALTSGLPLSNSTADWEREHPDVVKKYRLTWGLFASSAEDDPSFNYEAYRRQIERGDRTPLTPEQRIERAQQHQAAWMYNKAKAAVGDDPSKQERELLAQFHEMLRQEYPAYGHDVAGVPAKADIEKVVRELRRSVADPKLAKTDQAKAASLYLAARDAAIAKAQELGAGTSDGRALTIEAAEPLRLLLGEFGRRIVAQYPVFGSFFDAVFSREVVSD